MKGGKMKIFIIGSTAYQGKMKDHQTKLETEGHIVVLPALDDYAGKNELGVCEFNRACIEQCDEIHVIWDGRSTGTIFDMGMAFMLRKPVKIIHINNKTFENLFHQIAGQ